MLKLVDGLPFPKPEARERDREYMSWVRSQPCCASDLDFEHPCGSGPLWGKIDADHVRRNHGANRKGDDRYTIPLCHLHHMQRTNWSGAFRAFTRETMREWTETQLRSLLVRRYHPPMNVPLGEDQA